MAVEPAELSWELDGLCYAGLAWGDPQRPKILALHGWLDNAASFARLAPLLSDYHVIAVDLSGHGRSSWRSPDATYQIYDDLPQLISLLDVLQWPPCHLLGHSRGAIIATLLAASFPERVERLVLLDGMAPQATPDAEFSTQIREFVAQRQRLQAKSAMIYPSIGRAVNVRALNGLSKAAAELLVPRGLRANDEGYSWSFDPRLRGASAMKLNRLQIAAMLKAVAAPTLLLMAEDGLEPRMSTQLPELVKLMTNARMEAHPGGHHFHLEDSADTLAASITEFLQLKC